MRKERSIGSILCMAAVVLKYAANAPSYVLGFVLGLALCFLVIGLLPDRAYNALKLRKKKLFTKDSHENN